MNTSNASKKAAPSSSVSFRRAGKAIGGGRLTHVVRGGAVVGTINETLGLFIATIGIGPDFTVCQSMDEARAMF